MKNSHISNERWLQQPTIKMDKANLTVIILTLNEERHIARCINCAFQVAKQVFIVDSFSTDKTVLLAESLGARVWQHEFVNHAMQLDWGIRNLPIDTEWVMRMDADEMFESDFAESIRRNLCFAQSDVSGFVVSLYVKFQGKLIRHGGYPQSKLKIWRNGMASVEQRWMDEHMVFHSGKVNKINGLYIDDNLNNITWWTNKHNAYATREAIDILRNKYNCVYVYESSGRLFGGSRYKRWLKENIYVFMPLGFRSLLFFLYRMIFLLGFLDGRSGFVFHFLQGFWYRFLVDVKIFEVERRMHVDSIECVEAIRREFGMVLPNVPTNDTK